MAPPVAVCHYPLAVVAAQARTLLHQLIIICYASSAFHVHASLALNHMHLDLLRVLPCTRACSIPSMVALRCFLRPVPFPD